jgi:hypothetical protein
MHPDRPEVKFGWICASFAIHGVFSAAALPRASTAVDPYAQFILAAFIFSILVAKSAYSFR